MRRRPLFVALLLGAALMTGSHVRADTGGIVVFGHAIKPGRFTVTPTTTLLDVWKACDGPNRVWGRFLLHYGLNADGQRVLLARYHRRDYATEELWLKQLSMILVADGDQLSFPDFVC